MSIDHYSVIILAAGLSSRMKRFKPTLPLGDTTVVGRLIAAFQQNSVEVVLVAGYHQDELRASLNNSNIQVAENPNYERGMFTSIQTGLCALGSGSHGVFIAPADIPLVRPSTIRNLISTAHERPGKLIYPVFDGKRGHPPLVPGEIIPALVAWPQDGNLKDALKPFENISFEVEVPDRNTVLDMDSPADYEELLERFGRYEIPTREECEVILRKVRMEKPQVYRHSLKVAQVAGAVAKALLEAGVKLDIECVLAAALLHDLAKGQPNHEASGASQLAEMGFGKIADIVRVHTDLAEDNRISLESKIVYLSDKLTGGETVISIEDRFREALNKFGTTPEITANIDRRRQKALDTRKEIESLLGYGLEQIVYRL
jgi:molybdenum cofactor cytidylyltransferase